MCMNLFLNSREMTDKFAENHVFCGACYNCKDNILGENIASSVSLSDIRGAHASDPVGLSSLSINPKPTSTPPTQTKAFDEKKKGLTLQQKEEELRRQENEKKLKR